ncbi:MAG: hypothetical protein R2932_42195 [Caldilineaceae bacterium]
MPTPLWAVLVADARCCEGCRWCAAELAQCDVARLLRSARADRWRATERRALTPVGRAAQRPTASREGASRTLMNWYGRTKLGANNQDDSVPRHHHAVGTICPRRSRLEELLGNLPWSTLVAYRLRSNGTGRTQAR